MTSTRHAPRTVLAALAAVALLVSGCGGSGATHDAASTPSAASSAASRTPSPADGDASPDAPDGATPAEEPSDPGASGGSSTGKGLDAKTLGQAIAAAQRKAGSYRFTMTTTSAGQKVTGHGEGLIADDGSSAVRSVTEIAGQKIETIAIGRLFYLKIPSMPSDRPWVKVDPSAEDGLGALLGQLGGNSDPARNIGALFEASTVRKAGEEKVGGTATDRYHVTLPRKAFSKVMGLPEELVTMLPATVEYDVYVDGDDLVRRMRSEMSVQGAESLTDVEFSDYGARVRVKAPPADQVTTKSPLG